MSVTSTILKLLSFRLDKEDMLSFNNKHLAIGVLGTWIVGMGRYWDDPGAKLLQHLGMGSVIYIFCLALFIWMILLPFKPKGWSYRVVLTFISLTSFPAILYAIPVERFFSMSVASTMNVWFLAVVALWRLSLLFYFLRVFTRLFWMDIMTTALLPMCAIVTALALLNLERAVFNIMGGLRDSTANDDAYAVLLVITLFSEILVIPLLLIYISAILRQRRLRKRKQKN